MEKIIISEIFEIFEVIALMFIGFFIVITGIGYLPILANISGDGSLVPFFYSISIVFSFVYFFYYKVAKIMFKNGKNNKGRRFET